ncbi:MAG TPA: hypothetical protein VES20_00120, partial [Bryobacteraceae bacterium]|nr:hypothetical protein [Bryobacteraceae bacterium]
MADSGGMTRRMVLLGGGAALALQGQAAAPEGELIFPVETWHNHSSSVVELPGGDLMVCWFHGSGERTADDVKVLGARKPRGAKEWSAPFELADTPGFPD